MVTRMQLEHDQIAYLKLLIEDDLDRARDHLKWLTDTPEGQRAADRDQRIADTETSMRQATALLAIFA